MMDHEVEEMAREVCAAAGVEAPEVALPAEGALELVGGVLVVPGWAARPVAVAHMLAHHATPRQYPAHGVEFAGAWLDILDGVRPSLGHAMREALRATGVRHDRGVQARDVRRRLVDVVNNNPGSPAFVVVADPPAELYGPITGARGLMDGVVVVDGEPIPLERVRYASSPRRPRADDGGGRLTPCRSEPQSSSPRSRSSRA